MITKVVLRRFKRFSEVEIPLGAPILANPPAAAAQAAPLPAAHPAAPAVELFAAHDTGGAPVPAAPASPAIATLKALLKPAAPPAPPPPVVLAGPNNSGKTTVLQAIAAWSVAFQAWKEQNRFQRYNGVHKKAPVTRERFAAAVPLRKFDLLWKDLEVKKRIEIELSSSDGWTIAMELERDSNEQIYVRPKPGLETATLKQASVKVVYVPPITGLSTQEPVYLTPKIDQLLGLGRPGEVLRNLLVEAWTKPEAAWQPLTKSIGDLFGYELVKPDATGADILVEYRDRVDGPLLDVASAGSGFQQVLLLLTFLHARPASVLLVDEPDAHLHILLQEDIYDRLRRLAFEQRSQIILATHSEVVINTVDPENLCILRNGKARRLQSPKEKARLKDALKVVTHVELMRIDGVAGVLYVEGYTDFNLLKERARILGHPALETLTKRCFCKELASRPQDAKAHYEALCLYRPDLPGLILIDGDNKMQRELITGKGYQKMFWRRYDVECYLVHPTAIERFVADMHGGMEASELARRDALAWFHKTWRTTNAADFMGEYAVVEDWLKEHKARADALPHILKAAGLKLQYTDYDRIAAVMLPGEIHPEVVEKLNAIQKAFGLS